MTKFLLSLLLAALSMSATAGAGREAIRPTREDESETVVLRMFDSPEEVVKQCLDMGVWKGRTVASVLSSHPAPGCNAYAPATHVCTILTLRPRYVEDTSRIENLGHETLHCFRGLYHEED